MIMNVQQVALVHFMNSQTSVISWHCSNQFNNTQCFLSDFKQALKWWFLSVRPSSIMLLRSNNNNNWMKMKFYITGDTVFGGVRELQLASEGQIWSKWTQTGAPRLWTLANEPRQKPRHLHPNTRRVSGDRAMCAAPRPFSGNYVLVQWAVWWEFG